MTRVKLAVGALALLTAGASGTAVYFAAPDGTIVAVEVDDPALVAYRCVYPTGPGHWTWRDSAERCPSGTTPEPYVVPDACDVGLCVQCLDCVPDDETVDMLCCEPISGELNCYQISNLSECQNDWLPATCHFGMTNPDGSETCFY
jgi:hypothetical protein